MSKANGITRHEILMSIKRHGSMTADELHRELSISQVAVRQHLASLEAENIIAVTVDRRGLGRPSHRYHLTPQGDETFPRSYDRLADELLDGLREWQGDAAVDTLLTRKRDQVRAELQSRLKQHSLPERLKEIARHQTEQGYMAEIVDDGSGISRLVQHNCSRCAVARHHPNICCKGDMAMFAELLGDVEMVRETNIMDGDPTCSFRIRSCE